MRNKFDMQLELLNEQLIHMGELCEVAIDKATTGPAAGKYRAGEGSDRTQMKRSIRWRRTSSVCA